jgi:DNA mismatch repair protein MutS
LESIHENSQESGVGSPEPDHRGNKIKNLSIPKMQLSIFDAHSETFEEIRKLLQDMDINRLTPVEALLKLQEIKNRLK